MIKAGWILLVTGGAMGIFGLVLAASLPSRIDATALRCGLELSSNMGVLERALGPSSCVVGTAAEPGGDPRAEARRAPDARR